MQLTDAQKQQVASWIAEGLKLSQIQQRLEKECGLLLTYMEVRFLMDDLKIMPQDLPPPPPVAMTAPDKSQSSPGTPPAPASQGTFSDAAKDEPAAESGPLPGSGGVSVTVDKIARPGAMVSGSVTFSDGQSGNWYLDEMGRLGLGMKQKGYRPAAADVQEFQIKLQQELARQGF